VRAANSDATLRGLDPAVVYLPTVIGRAPGRDNTASAASRTHAAGPTSLLGEFTATFATAISSIGLSIALATLIFSGPLQDGLPRATTNFLLAGAIVTAVVGLRGGFKPTVGVLQDGPAIVMVTVAAGITTSGSPQPTLDVMVVLAATTLLAGIFMVLIGSVGVGDVVRFLPTTAIAGFIVGTCCLLAKGGFHVMLDTRLTPRELSGSRYS